MSATTTTRPRPTPAPRPVAQRSITVKIPSLRRPSIHRHAVARGTQRKTLLIGIAAVILIAAVGVIDVVLSSRADDRAAVVQAQHAAVKAAQTRVPAILSYDYKTLAHDLKAAQTNTTGTFHTDYQKLLSTVVEPSAQAKQIVNKATVTGAGVVSGDTQHVVVLVFVTQTTTSAAGGTPLVSGSRVNVTMTKTHRAWLVSALDPV